MQCCYLMTLLLWFIIPAIILVWILIVLIPVVFGLSISAIYDNNNSDLSILTIVLLAVFMLIPIVGIVIVCIFVLLLRRDEHNEFQKMVNRQKMEKIWKEEEEIATKHKIERQSIITNAIVKILFNEGRVTIKYLCDRMNLRRDEFSTYFDAISSSNLHIERNRVSVWLIKKINVAPIMEYIKIQVKVNIKDLMARFGLKKMEIDRLYADILKISPNFQRNGRSIWCTHPGLEQTNSSKKRKRKGIPKQIKDYVMKRDQFKCRRCGIEKGPYVSLQIDHIQPHAKGGSDLPENLQVLCANCNFTKKDLTEEEELVLCEKR